MSASTSIWTAWIARPSRCLRWLKATASAAWSDDSSPGTLRRNGEGWAEASGFGVFSWATIASRTIAALANAPGPIVMNCSGPSKPTLECVDPRLGSKRTESAAAMSSLKTRATTWIASSCRPLRAAMSTSPSSAAPFTTPLRGEGSSRAIAWTSTGAMVPVAGVPRIAWTLRIDSASKRVVLISMASSSRCRSSGPGAGWRSTWLLIGSRAGMRAQTARLPAVAWSARICAAAQGTGGPVAGGGRAGSARERVVPVSFAGSMRRRYARLATAGNQGSTLRLGLELALAKLDPADLAGERLRQVVDELDLARVRVGAQPRPHVVLDVLDQLVTRGVALGQHDERLDHVSAPFVGRRDSGRLLHGRVLEAGGLDLERADPVAGGDDHVVGAALVPDVAVLVEARRVLGVEPVAAERLSRRLLVAPVPERIVRVRAGAQADLAPLAGRYGMLVLVEDLHVPARHRPPHRALSHPHERVVGDQRIALGQPVVVEHGQAVLLAEPADRLGVQGLARRAHRPEALRMTRPPLLDRHHRPHRRRRGEDVRHLVARQEVQLLVRIEAARTLE